MSLYPFKGNSFTNKGKEYSEWNILSLCSFYSVKKNEIPACQSSQNGNISSRTGFAITFIEVLRKTSSFCKLSIAVILIENPYFGHI
ncbi:hypothetical protein EVA_07425 [gut metagenome]|uniref:Uncharacterized protein n=1 Tax=gut metagenome TaxID=749906 RepID=J9GVA6_9ZZZZ